MMIMAYMVSVADKFLRRTPTWKVTHTLLDTLYGMRHNTPNQLHLQEWHLSYSGYRMSFMSWN